MPELQIGFDYHLAETRRTGMVKRGLSVSPGWEAYCDACGWVGARHGSKSAADDDASAHDVAEN